MPRRFDRRLVIEVSDVWDNNTFGFVAAAVARGARRERLATEGFRWMAAFGADRRTWVLEQAAAAGHPVELPHYSDPYGVHARDFRGVVRATQVPLTPEVAGELRADYDLGTARVRHLCIQRYGVGRGHVVAPVDGRPGGGSSCSRRAADTGVS